MQIDNTSPKNKLLEILKFIRYGLFTHKIITLSNNYYTLRDYEYQSTFYFYFYFRTFSITITEYKYRKRTNR